jgi:hypothetical protein
MGMMPVYFTTTSFKKRKKQKFTNAAAAQSSRENQESWKKLLLSHGVKQQKVSKTIATLQRKPVSYRGSDLPKIPSLKDTWEPCTKPADKVYTGDAIVGISTMHKSNAVPVFNKQAAIDISKMRR